jgi:hypothetical protein
MPTQTGIAQKITAENVMKIFEFHKYVIAAVKKSYFQLDQIGNMDEILLTSEIPSKKTMDIKCAK